MDKFKRILAIDPGKVRIGLAISNSERTISSPLANYTRRDRAQDLRYLKKVVDDNDIGLLIVGLPVHLNGNEGFQARQAREVGDWIARETGLPCIFVDERYTTLEAESVLWLAGLTHKQRKARRDQVAAQILLQGYLEAGCPSEQRNDPIESDKK